MKVSYETKPQLIRENKTGSGKMEQHWLQVRGDPAVRSFVFQQQRVESLFDIHINELHAVVQQLLCMRGIFHAKIHYSSNQLPCWEYHDPYRYRVFVGEEVFHPNFLEQFGKVLSIERPVVPSPAIGEILVVFKRLRFQDNTIYLRNASINRINGTIGVVFSCDGSHYIDYEAFYSTVELLWSSAHIGQF